MTQNERPVTSTTARRLTRREALSALSAAAVASSLKPYASRAQSAAAARTQLPLRTTGLEHMGTVVPDVAASGRFYGRLFNPLLYKEKAPPLRYYVTLDPGYIALGSRANAPRAFFDHFCALVEDYDPAAMARELEAAGLPAGRFGIIPDPDGIGLQLLGVPGGLAKSTEPAGRIVEAEALVRPRGLEQVVLYVSELEKSAAFYRGFFGRETERERDRMLFRIVNTQLVLQTAPRGESPRIDRIRVKAAPFDRDLVARELTRLGAQLEKSAGEALRFRDPVGLGIELGSV